MKKWIVGVDEVGRGPIAGPVTVCVCAISKECYKKYDWHGLTDSKKMTQKKREVWYQKAKILKKERRIFFAVISRSAKDVDRKGIQKTIRECIDEGFHLLNFSPKEVMVYLDGGLIAPQEYKQKTIIKGDIKEKSISLASVIAKVSRDTYMTMQAKKYPSYGFEQHKGYGTSAHYEAIKKYGTVTIHRNTYLKKYKNNILY